MVEGVRKAISETVVSNPHCQLGMAFLSGIVAEFEHASKHAKTHDCDLANLTGADNHAQVYRRGGADAHFRRNHGNRYASVLLRNGAAMLNPRGILTKLACDSLGLLLLISHLPGHLGACHPPPQIESWTFMCPRARVQHPSLSCEF